MFGGGGMNPRKLQQMMQQMGIDVTEIDATEVRISTADGTDLVFDGPEVTRMDAQGQQTYQIVGDPSEEEGASSAETSEPGIPDADVDIVVDRTGVDPDTARDALAEADGDLAAAISQLE